MPEASEDNIITVLLFKESINTTVRLLMHKTTFGITLVRRIYNRLPAQVVTYIVQGKEEMSSYISFVLLALAVTDCMWMVEPCNWSVSRPISRRGSVYAGGSVYPFSVHAGIRFRWRKRREAANEEASMSRNRRDATELESSCKCDDTVSLSRLSVADLESMKGHLFTMEVTRLYDPNGTPVYDVIELTRANSHITGGAKKKYYLTTITNECDCTPLLHAGNITIYGIQRNNQLLHPQMVNTENLARLEKYVVNNTAVGLLAGGLVALLILVAVLAVLVVRRRRRNAEEGKKSEIPVGVDNGSYNVKPVQG